MEPVQESPFSSCPPPTTPQEHVTATAVESVLPITSLIAIPCPFLEDLVFGALVAMGPRANVYKGELEGKTVAVKVYKGGDGEDDDELLEGEGGEGSEGNAQHRIQFLSKLFTTATTLGMISHVCFPGFIGCSFRGAENCIVMEYIRGQTLFDCLEDGTMAKYRWKTVLGLLSDFAKGLVHLLDEHGMVHGDLHLCNLMVSSEGTGLFKRCQGKICDLDDARSCKDVNFIPRNNYWLAPETWDGQYTSKSDVYSYGIIMWSLITRKLPPMYGESMMPDFEEMRSELNDLKKRSFGAKIMKLLRGGPSTTLLDLVQKCWKVDPDKRPNMNEILKVVASGA